MTTLIFITATFIIILAGLAWLLSAMGRWGNDVMDDIINRDRHNYKEAEREIEDN